MATLLEDIQTGSDWITQAFSTLNKNLDYSIESLSEIEKFFDEQLENGSPKPGSILGSNLGQILFGVASYVGNVLIRNIPGSTWVTDDNDSMGEVNIAVKLKSGALVWPMQRVMKRCKEGKENNIYDYGRVLYEQETK